MTHLLDVSVLLALADSKHVAHDKASDWFHNRPDVSWATCPLTENGFVRIMSQPAYQNVDLNAEQVRQLLTTMCALPGHQFWPDAISIRNLSLLPKLPGFRQLTDLYLLALATKRQARFATLDARIEPALVPGGPQAFHLIR